LSYSSVKMRCVCGYVAVCALLAVCADGLKCYTCSMQTSNARSACTKNMTTCSPYQDTCTTIVHFTAPVGTASYRKAFINKGCDSWRGCQYRSYVVNEFCDRNSYKDWGCVDCCTGDLCNYYVKMGSSHTTSSVSTLILTLIFCTIFCRIRSR